MKVFADPVLSCAALAASEAANPRQLLDALPVAIYATDADGKITFYNEAAAELWGTRPLLEAICIDSCCKLYWRDGATLPYGNSPMAQVLAEAKPIHGVEVVVERQDGVRIPVVASSTPLLDPSGKLSGAVTMLVDLSENQQPDWVAHRLAAIVESSDDAILAKDLNGIIMSWNRGAQRLFGYTADEAIGKSVTLLIPEERHNEEPAILARIRRGERIEHYDTVRRRKDGGLVDISLSVSPVRNSRGEIIGASKIARDITERRRAEEQQQLLLREMDHRVKNLFALAGSVVTLSARSATKTEDLVASVRARLNALSRAHALTLTKISEGAISGEQPTTLHTLIRTIVLPFDAVNDAEESRVSISGPDIAVGGRSVTSLALLLHEFATNAAKYGALSQDAGSIQIECFENGPQFVLIWTEHGGPPVAEIRAEGFGTLLGRVTVSSQLAGEIQHDWSEQGLKIRLSVAADRLSP